MGILKPIIITFLSIVILAWLLPSITYLSWSTLIIASVVLTLLQKIVRPILSLLLLPINIITLGMFSWVINVLILWFATAIVPGFHIDQVILFGFQFGAIFSLIIVSFLLSLIQAVIDLVF
jgi:putative membrane protein